MEETEPLEYEEEEPIPCVVLLGNIIDGFQVFGPFYDTETAEDWATENDPHFEAIVMSVNPVDSLDTEEDEEDDDEDILEALLVEHEHKWGRSVFLGHGGLEVRHCEDDCPATEAKNSSDEWERVA